MDNQQHQPVNPYVNPQGQYQQPVNPYANPQGQYQQPVNPYVNPQVQNQPPVQAVPIQKPVRRSGTTRDLIMAILTGVLCFVMTDCFVWTGTLGLGFAAGALLFLAAEVWYIMPSVRRKSAYGAACVLLLAAGCASLVFSADHFMKFLTFVCLAVLTTCMLMESMELRVWQPGSFGSIGDYFYTAYAASFGKIAAGMYGLFHREVNENSKRKTGVGKALLGLVIALPLVLIIAFLLYNGDQAFRGMLDGINFEKLPERLLSVMLAVPIFILLFSRLFSLRDLKRDRREESGRGLDPLVLTFFLLGISVVYLAYLFSQLAYFFNGFMGFLPADFTYAEYARRGFFELMVVSVINIIVLILCTALCRKKEGRLPLGVKLTLLFLCCFSLVLVLTEVAKMKMYMDSYGLTRLRILTTLFTVFLAVIFMALIVRLFVKKTPYMKIAVIVGAVMVIALSFINIDGVIARYNVQAYRNGTLNTIDVQAITELNDAAVPSLLELAADENPDIAKEAARNLYLRRENLFGEGEPDSYDFREFNLTSYRARQLLLENEELISARR